MARFEVEAKDETARSFYLRFGALPLLDDEDHLVVDQGLFRP